MQAHQPLPPLDPALLPGGIRARHVENGNGLRMHLLEAGQPGQPCLLLLHGFPELAYSWRKVMPALAAAGYHVIAPDQRGYGRTTGWDGRYDGGGGDQGGVESFRFFNLVRDALGLLHALGIARVHAVIGHDFGSPLAGCCALLRPDVFPAVMMMSAPFAGPPALSTAGGGGAGKGEDLHAALAALDPPRRHYQWYYSTPRADGDMLHCAQGLHDFLRAYYHMKSADWPDNAPHRLPARTAAHMATMPHYYIMPMAQDMAQCVAPHMPSAGQIAACDWLPDRELAVYSGEYARTGFQGGLQWYRNGTGGRNARDLELFAGRTIDVPAGFISGKADWGTYQWPGDLEHMEGTLCTQFRGTHLVPGAGHWVQQEQPQAVTEILLAFLAGL